MNSRHILNLALVIAVCMLIIFSIYGPGSKTPDIRPVVTTLDLATINTIQVWHRDTLTLKFVRNNNTWQLEKPFSYPASNFQVASLLAIAQEKSHSTIDPDNHDLKKFGLDKPVYRLVLDEKIIEIGNTEPLNFRRYVLYDNKIHLIDDSRYRFLSQEAVKFANKKIIPAGQTISSIQAANFTLSREADDSAWKLSPDNSTVSADEKNRLVYDWLNLQAIDIRSWDKHDEPSNQTVTLGFTDNTSLQLWLLQLENKFYLVRRDAGLKFEISDSSWKALFALNFAENKPQTGNLEQK